MTTETLDDRLSSLESRLSSVTSDYEDALDTVWMLLATLLVFFMHAGFSMVEVGSVRVKNAPSILAKNLLVVTVGVLCWYAVGFHVAFRQTTGWGTLSCGSACGSGLAMGGLWKDKAAIRTWLFQCMFCATSGTIVSGAMAERTHLAGFGIYTVAMSSLIYPMAVYWCWSKHGFLRHSNSAGESVSIFGPAYLDFAGSGIVHLVGGVGALCGAAIVGPRQGRFRGIPQDEIVRHNVPLCVLGTLSLWIGWFGFNPGSTGQMHDRGTAHLAGLVAVNSVLAPCTSGLVVFVFRATVLRRRFDLFRFCNGILAGLVGITAGCAYVKPWEAVIIGFVAGLVYQGAALLLVRLQVDDVVDAFAVHGVGGLWALIALGLFGDPKEGLHGNGLFYGGDQLRTQVLSALLMAGWSGLLSSAIFLTLRRFGILHQEDGYVEGQDNVDVFEHTVSKAYACP